MYSSRQRHLALGPEDGDPETRKRTLKCHSARRARGRGSGRAARGRGSGPRPAPRLRQSATAAVAATADAGAREMGRPGPRRGRGFGVVRGAGGRRQGRVPRRRWSWYAGHRDDEDGSDDREDRVPFPGAVGRRPAPALAPGSPPFPLGHGSKPVDRRVRFVARGGRRDGGRGRFGPPRARSARPSTAPRAVSAGRLWSRN